LAQRDEEIVGVDHRLKDLYDLGTQSHSDSDIEPALQDFTRYALEYFRPDTFGILLEEDSKITPLVFFDRYGRQYEPSEPQNSKIYRFPLGHLSFKGHIYIGYDSGQVQLLLNQKHIFGLFRDRIESRLKEHYIGVWHQQEMRKMFISSIQAHARSIEAKDAYTAGHCDRVDRYAELLARHHGEFDEKWIFNLKVGSILHDIGKIGVRSSILRKPASLDHDECERIRMHPAIGGRIVRTYYGINLEPIVRNHHERFDGKGYPDGLKGEQIPIESRIILIADTFDAMTSDRPYRKAMTTERAFDELRRYAGTQFDPDLVNLVHDAAGDFEAARQQMMTKPGGDYFTS